MHKTDDKTVAQFHMTAEQCTCHRCSAISNYKTRNI